MIRQNTHITGSGGNVDLNDIGRVEDGLDRS